MKLVLGTVQFGLEYGVNNQSGKPSQEQVFEILKCASQAGIKNLDTADGYGNSQEVIAQYLTKNKKQFKIMGKFSWDKNFTQCLDFSLSSLGIQSLDSYYFHKFSDFQKFTEFDLVHQAKQQQRFSKLGVSLYSLEHLKIAAQHPEVDIIQLPVNIFDFSEEKKSLLNIARANNKLIYVRSVFLQGLFFMHTKKMPEKLLAFVPYIEKIQALAQKYNIDVAALALQYVDGLKEVDGIVIGVDSLEQLQKNLKFYKAKVPEECLLEAQNIKIPMDLQPLLNPSHWN